MYGDHHVVEVRRLLLEMPGVTDVYASSSFQVVEVAFDGVQSSNRYPGGVALRFARVRGYRDDKTAAEADTIDTVLAIHRGRVRPRLSQD